MSVSVPLNHCSDSASCRACRFQVGQTYLVVVWRGRAVGTEIAVDRVTRVALVGVDFQVTFGQGESILGREGVEGIFTAGLEFAGLAVAEDMGLGVGVEVDFPLYGAAMALALVGFGHAGGWTWRGRSEV